MDNQNNKQQTKFPQKQTKLNQAEVENDYLIDNIPYDFTNMMRATSDPEIKRAYDEFKQRTLYIYEIERLFKNNENNSLKFSANTIKIGFIDIDKVLKTIAAETSDFTMQLNQRASTNINDNTIEYSMTDIKNLIFQEINLLNQFKLYAVSINEPLTENNIYNLYIINNYSQPYQNPKTRSTKSITIIKIKDFKTRDGYPIIIKLQKPLDKDTKVTGLKIKAPRSMIFGNIKVLGEVDNMEVYPKLFVKDKIAFPLLSMPIETQPKVRILEQWFSEQILPWNLAKQFIGQEKSVLDLIVIGSGKETRKEIFNNARVTNAWLGYYTSSHTYYPWPLREERQLKDKEVWKIHDALGTTYTSIATNDKFKDVELEIKDAPTIDSLQQLLLDMLTYTYSYNRNFDGAEYNNSNPSNEIAKLRQKFEGQKPEDVITNLFKQWKLDYPNYINLSQVQIFKKIVVMLSNNIYSLMSINKGLNDDYKLLLPYYFELKSNPIHSTPDKVWEFKDAKVLLKSAYFDFTNINNIKLKNNDISQNELFKLDDNQFNWLSITNELESNNIPSLIPADWTLGNGEYGKYFTRIVINNTKIENVLNLYGSNKSQLFSKLEFYKEISPIDNDNEFELQIENPINNLNRIEISGIFGAGNYDLVLITDEKEINLTNITLFDKYNENISYINLEI
ncbi:MAG: hypothetical protein PPFGHCPK_01336 [Spiroplasma endosymbiont of Drosophila atripex]|nr:MAG: hypothetical protein PPFGHCPK_00020 [Spiroplasma endosymbiont of Drosophila atripex]WDA53881.1 MAG: hypothetical protein PPFGHCPK_00295 [Spiroplasma endosymbiont of Drosophila atripex]WDA54609.1 MAG: hypothetical protein PPFGHCPK_01065 [Spiroplasma endosymbiont of Drosophila atripex]WDA54855.1 MAG: hypothetical protein PPFGHCPK_01336 [Spiroplasma endosymbiont of Drosophila atripex]